MFTDANQEIEGRSGSIYKKQPWNCHQPVQEGRDQAVIPWYHQTDGLDIECLPESTLLYADRKAKQNRGK